MEAKIRVEWLYSEAINYALQQNHVPVVKEIVLTNLTEEDMNGLDIKLEAEPLFAYEWSKVIDVLPAGQAIDIGQVSLQLIASFLSAQSERINGSLTLSVIQNGVVLVQQHAPIGILAFDEWSGLRILPEMAAAFVTPNTPYVIQLVREAAELLGKWSGSSAFSAYQSKDPNRVRLQAAAIYHTIQSQSIVYCVAPPSFEEIGQRVRLPDFIMNHRMGNCLDLSLLYAACLEAVGLHPLLVFTEGHAFVGVWLIEETFAESVQDDSSLLTKRIASGINEICVMEATLLTDGKSEFDRAAAVAASHLNHPDKFECAVDIRRARAGGIRPLPQRNVAADGWQDHEARRTIGSTDYEAPELLDVIAKPVEVDTIPMSKQRYWERRLLDLSLRNSLLNFRLTKSSVLLMTLQLGELEDALAERTEFQLLPRPQDWNDQIRSTTLYQELQNNHPMEPLLQEEFKRSRLRADLAENDLEHRLIQLHRSAKLSLEENGANTLYLALGLLKWYETNVSEAPRYAPLVLVPVNLVKRVMRGGFVIRGREEEPQLNITLLEMLRQDFGITIGGLDPLPRDEKGIDLKRVFAVLRHALMPFSRWDIEETALLGLFSFGQFVMWNDLRMRADELAENNTVSSLMEGRLTWQQPELAEEGQAFDDCDPTELLLPISTDSSQLRAIQSAIGGQSFVLHGPPGTGKSQTITNMIAGALAQGKRVLFVAEKMAALSVVQKRLEGIGLGPFCLELHSNKSTKRAVLDQLQGAIEAPRRMSASEWKEQAGRLAKLRGELNGYITALHKQHPFGFSLFEAIAGYERVDRALVHPRFDAMAVADLRAEQITRWRDLTTQLSAAGKQCGYSPSHSWRDAGCTTYSQGMRGELEALLPQYSRKLEDTEQACLAALDGLNLPRIQLTRARIEQIVQLCSHMLNVPDVKPALLKSSHLQEEADKLRKAAQQGKLRDEIKQQISVVFVVPEALRFDAAMVLSEWSKSELAWFLPRLLGQNRIVKLLRTITVPGASIAKAQVKPLLASLIQWQDEEQRLAAAQQSVTPFIGASLWNDDKGAWEEIAGAADWAVTLQELLHDWFADPLEAVEGCSRIADMLVSGRNGAEQHFPTLQKAKATFAELSQQEERLAAMLQLRKKELELNASNEPWCSFMGRKTALWLENIDLLRDWCAYLRVRQEAAAEGLLPLIERYEEGQLAADELSAALDKGLYHSCANYIFENDERLGTFSGSLFEEKIARYRETDKRFEELTRQEIFARLSARVPQMSQEAAQSSEAGILQRAIRSGGRSISIRKLFDSIPHLLPRLTPCMLMSPISVAQYLDPSSPKFDLVIFDEASQVPTAQAVGALARGHQSIIVGDPKQLPPTSFFSRGNEEEEEDGVMVQDMESILDDCLALGIKQLHLTWHYRSRHESLIAFSNAHYYDNKLMTFPSPNEPVSSVSMRPIEGFYDRGRTKQNRAEAEAVIAEIAHRLKSPELRRFSIGVVTFSSIQQTLIEDMLDQALKEDLELERLMQELPEPLFIKNLENVQGDERDIILFSIGYGPDANGKVSLNFGPLNREGGWRRLNVAVSRARHEMIVFSTLRSNQLSVNRTSAEGVHGLKAFLEYAEKGSQGLPAAAASQISVMVTDIHRSLAAELEKRGYKADLYVGSSGYRIDVGLIDPDNEGQYCLGILLDGPMYASAQTARDRDVLRIQVLEGLGWTLHQLWMPDWWDNRIRELDKIEQAVKEAKAAAAARAIKKKEEADADGSGQDQLEAVEAKAEAVTDAPVEEDSNSRNSSGNGDSDNESFTQTAPSASTTSSSLTALVELSDDRSGLVTYRVTKLEPVQQEAEAFYQPLSTSLLLSQMKQVLNEEAPISRSLLMKRVLQAWGISRAGAKVERRFDELFAKMNCNTTLSDGTVILWADSVSPEQYSEFRIADMEDLRRSAEDLPAEETANAVRHILMSQISLPAEDLVKQAVRLLGYSRSGTALDKAIRSGIEIAVERGYAMMSEDGRVILMDR